MNHPFTLLRGALALGALAATTGMSAHAQSVGVGTLTPNPAAILDVSSTTQGLLPPRMSPVQRDALSPGSSAAGLLVYNTESKTLNLWDGTRWTTVPGSGTWSVSGMNYYFTTGKIGIGTATPAQQLDVAGGNIKISTAGNGLIFPDNSVQTTASIAGPTGPAGTTGATGAAGPTGATGATGNTGAIGNTGAAGPNGADGVAGMTGAIGPIGNTGAVGTTGVAGATGTTGAIGATGAAGAVGATGVTGAIGNTGAIGATGVAGATGATGNTGAVGAMGVAGATGNTGAIGNTGATGTTGATGLNGPTGATGNIGMTGATGNTGLQGAMGATGANGTNGKDGAAGAAGSNASVTATNGVSTTTTAGVTTVSLGGSGSDLTAPVSINQAGNAFSLLGGSLGIGTASPVGTVHVMGLGANTLHLQGATHMPGGVISTLVLDTYGNSLGQGNNMKTLITGQDDGYAGGILNLVTNGANRLSILNNGSVGIGTSAPNASAVLDISSSSKGLLLPRLTNTQMQAMAPVPGMIIYNVDAATFMGYQDVKTASLIDQSANNGGISLNQKQYSGSVTQSFTAVSTLIDYATVYAFLYAINNVGASSGSSAPLQATFSIANSSGTLLGSATGSFSVSTSDTPITLNLSASGLTVGQVYTLTITRLDNSTSGFALRTSSSNPYSGGSLSGSSGADLEFQIGSSGHGGGWVTLTK